MISKNLSPLMVALLAIFGIASVMTPTRATAQTERVLHNFGGVSGAGEVPGSSLIFDSAGNLYGTTEAGGANKVGVVFELSPRTGGGWTQKVLHSFSAHDGDGQTPQSGLVFDSAGNLYGTASGGGTDGVGAVFELSPPVPPSTEWSETVIYSFLNNGVDGQNPLEKLIFDSAGNLYSTTFGGGGGTVGTVFELSPSGGGLWTETLLHTFSPVGDGDDPRSGLTMDAAGNLYGVTLFGGAHSDGTVYELTPSAGGTWTETILYSFAVTSVDGGEPAGGLIFDSAGNLYGTTTVGGPEEGGIVFKLKPSGGTWTETVLHYFLYHNSADGFYPFGDLAFDSLGNLCGATLQGGTGSCSSTGSCGVVFKLRPATPLWTERIAHNFNADGIDGFFPAGGVVAGAGGIIYGTASFGGTAGQGDVFAIQP
jgi:uncharacterized repeat protein (TIGR03803 family)